MLFEKMPSPVREHLLRLANSKVVALPESSDERVQQAAKILKQEGIQVRLSSEKSVETNRALTEVVLQKRAAERKKNIDAQVETLSQDFFFEAGAALERGDVDAVVGGATVPTAHVIRAALSTVGVDPAVSILTSCFLFALKDQLASGDDVVLYADCAVIPQPTAEQLVDIGYLAANAFLKWTGREPRVAFLSFSTMGSAQHADVSKVRSATEQFKSKYPNILADGEMQFDAAVVPEVGTRKAPDSKVAGRANVFVFPDLDAGNIGYKMTQRLAGADAWGPVLLGSAKPFSDLSRGASASDIAHAAILALSLK